MRAARFLAIVLLLVAILAAALYLLRLPIAGWAVRAGMAGAGLENPEARVTALTIDGARLQGVKAGPGGGAFRFETVEADFRLRRLWSERKVDAIRVRGGLVGVKIDETGRVSVAGLKQGGGSGGGALPFDRLSIEDVMLAVSSPEGEAQGTIDADYDIATGGAASLDLSAERFTWNTIRLMRVKSGAGITFSADGRAALAANFSGDVENGGVFARDVAVTLTGEGGSWRDAANGAFAKISGDARVGFAAPVIEIAGAEPQDETAAAEPLTIFGKPIREAGLTGALTVGFSEEGVIVRFAEAQAPLALTTPVGSRLTLSPQGAAPLYARRGVRETASFRFALKGEGVGISGAADIEQSGGVWRVAAPLVIDAFDNGDLSLGGTLLDVAATVQGKVVGVDAAIKSDIRKATVGRLTITDAPFAGAFRIDADLTAQSATVIGKNDCLAIDRLKGRFADQDMDLSLTGVAVCNAEAPLAEILWTGETAVMLAGDVSAKNGRLRFGETHAAGRPPEIRFAGAYRPSRSSTALTGGISGGAMTLNDALDLSGAAGSFDFALDADAMRANASISRLRIAQHLAEAGALPFFSPVVASGEAALADDKTRFSYVLTTPEGYRLGAGAGAHDMAAASGETVLSIENAVFRPDGLQPNRLSPRLKGIVDAAVGAMDGSVRFGWSRAGVTSGADFHFKNISFGGPTRAVTRTSGFNGDVQLTALSPLTTAGPQTVTVGAVDLDALQLEAGVISFEFPGDESVRLVSAEFPWFGGALGVYEATAKFTGEAMVPLRVQNIDLKQILDYVKIDGLSGEGVLSGSLPLAFREGRAFIENGFFESISGGVLRYVGAATEQAASEGGGAKIAFDILKDLRYRSMKVMVSGPLDGRLVFDIEFVGTGEVALPQQGLSPAGQGRLPVLYKVTLDAALIELLQQAYMTTDVKLQVGRGTLTNDGIKAVEPDR